MTKIESEKFNSLVDEIISWKTRPEYNWSWEKIQNRLYQIPFLSDLMEEDNEAYRYYQPLLIQAAKQVVEKASEIKGLAPKRENWFFTNQMKDGRYWHRFQKKMILNDWDDDRLAINEKQTVDIVNCLSDPCKTITSEESRFKKGLVYGNVQSGKTAHIASLISMYASAGCKLFIVLSGVTNNLRQQTQDRLRGDLEMDTTGNYDLLTSENDLIGKSLQQIQGKMLKDCCVIGIFKKNPAALRRLIDYLNNVNDKGFWKEKQVMIIDDECDQYSVNVKDMSKLKGVDEETGEEFDRSTINKLIVKMMHIFDKYAYVGFTATPFANVLNEPPAENSLYPSDFIYPLAMSDKYYGAKKIFGAFDDDPENPSPVLNAINLVDKDELNPKTADYSELPESLRKAILYFIVATAVKYKRGINKHSSLLVNVDMKIATHMDVQKTINQFVYDIKLDPDSFFEEMKDIWEEEKLKISFDTVKILFNYKDSAVSYYQLPEIEEISEEINLVIEKLLVVVDNSAIAKAARLSYHDEEEQTDVYIVIGGNTLSRGLTLEGLLVSYFYRTSALYDTLLQMGRWFGYRIHYEDLARIWTSYEIADKFSMLAQVEDELRDEFNQYGFDITPNDIAPRIRTYPGLQITRKLAMQSARANLINFCGYRPQTLFFPRKDSAWLKHNLEVTKSFLDSLKKDPSYQNNSYIFENISSTDVRKYISEMNIDERNSSFDKVNILKFLDKAKEHNFLNKWNVSVISTNKGEPLKISSSLTVNMVERSRMDMKATIDDEVYLKVLTRPEDMLIDTMLHNKPKENTSISGRFILRQRYFKEKNCEEPGLLLIYPINKDSKYLGKEKSRLDLKADEHIIGLTLVFPKEDRKELHQYMSIQLPEEL